MAIVNGTNLNDQDLAALAGKPDDDQYFGFAGDDWLIPSLGNDLLDGGDDTVIGTIHRDHLDYGDTSDVAGPGFQGLNANLVSGIVVDAWGGTESLISVENIIGTQFNESIVGGDG